MSLLWPGDHQKREINLVIERCDGVEVAVAVKATSSPAAGHLHHVRWLRDKLNSVAPETFRAGVLLQTAPPSPDRGRPSTAPPHRHAVVHPALNRPPTPAPARFRRWSSWMS